MLFEKRLEAINKSDLNELVVGEVRESRTLDYKNELPAHSQSNEKKGEFLADVSALANGDGGILIYGVEERLDNGQSTGIPGRIVGLRFPPLDEEENRLRGILMAQLDPRLSPHSVDFRMIDGFPNGSVLLVRVKKSWIGPHMVKLDGKYRDTFHVRDGAFNRKLDTQGIRDAMLASADLGERVRALATERLRQFQSLRASLLHPGPRIVLHVIPSVAARHGVILDPAEVEAIWNEAGIVPFFGTPGSCDLLYNVDGLLVTTKRSYNEVTSAGFAQVFRDGTLEIAGGGALRSHFHDNEIRSQVIEEELIRLIDASAKLLARLRVDPPLVAQVTLLGLSRYSHHSTRTGLGVASAGEPQFDRDVTVLPLQWLDTETLELGPASAAKPLLDAFWQAGGIRRSPSYENGQYRRTAAFDGVTVGDADDMDDVDPEDGDEPPW